MFLKRARGAAQQRYRSGPGAPARDKRGCAPHVLFFFRVGETGRLAEEVSRRRTFERPGIYVSQLRKRQMESSQIFLDFDSKRK